MTTPTKRIRPREFLIIFKDPDLNGFSHPNDFINHCKNVNSNYFKYLVFQWINNKDNKITNCKNFYQMYFEFNNNVSINKIKEDYFNGIDIEISPRLETQAEAIKKCSDQTNNLFLKDYFEYGEPKKSNKSYFVTNPKNKEIPLSHKEQVIHIVEEVKKGVYKSLRDIERDYPYLSYNKKTMIQDILYRNASNEKINVEPARVIWLFGKAGCGKTTWTDKFLNDNGYTSDDVTATSPISLQNYQTVWFNLEDQDKKVLVVNEVNESFPNDNNLIAWIDKKDSLQVKGARIRNNFELIIVNSVYRPEQIFSRLKRSDAEQVLRRIFNSYMDSRVYKITANYQQLEEAKSLNLSSKEFGNWYQPTVELIKEPDYSLMKEEKIPKTFFSKLKNLFFF